MLLYTGLLLRITEKDMCPLPILKVLSQTERDATVHVIRCHFSSLRFKSREPREGKYIFSIPLSSYIHLQAVPLFSKRVTRIHECEAREKQWSSIIETPN